MKQTRRKWFFLSLGIAAALFFLIDRALLPALSSRTDPYQPFKLLSQVVYLVKNDYVEKPDPERTMQGALKGLVDSLDVLSSYLEPELVALYRDRTNPAVKETGLILYKSFGVFPVVIGVKPDSPAQRSELHIGDSISAINGESTLGMSMLEANLSLMSRSEEPVELRLVRAQGDQNVELERAALQESLFTFEPSEGTAGILTIHALYPPLVDQVQERLNRIDGRGSPLILDFRTCAEGSIDEAVRLVNLFIKNKRIGWLEGRDSARHMLAAPADPQYPHGPLAAWTTQATVGAAELAVAALQKHRKARVIGLPTLGLAARQEFFPLKDGSGVVLTTAIFRPDEQTEIWTKGIQPDTSLQAGVPDTEAFLKATLENEPKR